ncbi:MAG TPA: hypothetical protein PKI91_02780 [Smithella sp.]|nr:hypothetical protein [Smithella sp.]
MKTRYDNKLIRCPKLGDEMTFSYCLQESVELPCARIIRCWSPCFDVEKILKETMEPEQWNNFTNIKSPDKMTSLIELIAAAKARK